MVPQRDVPSSSTRWSVGAAAAGARLDAFLAAKLSLSRQEVRRLLERGAVAVDGHRVSPRGGGAKLRPGETVDAGAFHRPQDMVVVPQPDLPLAVLASGEGWLAVDKPAGVPVHPLVEGETDTVLNAVAARFPGVQGVGEAGLRSGVVHRLDTDTSGTLAVAVEQGAWEVLREAFAAHQTQKVYRAIVVARMVGRGEEVVDLGVARHRPALVRVVPPETRGARRCDLAWQAVETLNGATLVEVHLGTGFLHQVRVTLAHLGHPVLGDAAYGGAVPLAAAIGVSRPMLHAAELAVGPIDVTSPDPADFAACLERLRG